MPLSVNIAVSHARWMLWLKAWDRGGNNSENPKINCHRAQCQLVKWNKTLENIHIALSYESIIGLCFAAIFGAPTISCDSLHCIILFSILFLSAVEYHNATSYSPFTSRRAKRQTLFAIDALDWYKARLLASPPHSSFYTLVINSLCYMPLYMPHGHSRRHINRLLVLVSLSTNTRN